MIKEVRPFFVAVHFAEYGSKAADLADTAIDIMGKDVGVKVSNFGGWHSNAYARSAASVIQDAADFVEKAATDIFRVYGIPRKAEIGSFWFNINRHRDYNTSHHHMGLGTALCAVMFVKSDSLSGRLVLERPDMCGSSPESQQETEHTLDRMFVDPIVGEVVFFPPNLRHYVEANCSDSNRISIAFNIK